MHFRYCAFWWNSFHVLMHTGKKEKERGGEEKKKKGVGISKRHSYNKCSKRSVKDRDIVAVKGLTFPLPCLPRRYSENDQ